MFLRLTAVATAARTESAPVSSDAATISGVGVSPAAKAAARGSPPGNLLEPYDEGVFYGISFSLSLNSGHVRTTAPVDIIRVDNVILTSECVPEPL